MIIVRTERVLVTPEFAAQLLDNNYAGNRNLRKQVVGSYSYDMSNGTFASEVGQAMVVHEDGTLLDGQHRCHAIINAGKPMWFFIQVVRGDKAEIYASIDKGACRSMTDSYGYISKDTAAILTIAVAVCDGSTPLESALQGKVDGDIRATANAKKAWYVENKDDVDAAVIASTKIRNAGYRGSPAVFGLWHLITSRLYSREKADYFVEQLVKWNDTDCKHALATGRAILQAKNKLGTPSVKKSDVLGIMATGFSSFICSKPAPKSFNKNEKKAEKLVAEYRARFSFDKENAR